ARTRGRMRGIPGMVSNILPLRLALDPRAGFASLLDQTVRRVRGALLHQRYRSEDLRHDLGLRPDEPEAHGTVVNFFPFIYNFRFAGYPARGHNLSVGPVGDLAIAVYDRKDRSDLRIDFDAR